MWNQDGWLCECCGGLTSANFDCCAYCGTPFAEAEIVLPHLTKKMPTPCPHCQQELPTPTRGKDKFCPYCGKSLLQTCRACGQKGSLQLKFCGNCGSEFAVAKFRVASLLARQLATPFYEISSYRSLLNRDCELVISAAESNRFQKIAATIPSLNPPQKLKIIYDVSINTRENKKVWTPQEVYYLDPETEQKIPVFNGRIIINQEATYLFDYEELQVLTFYHEDFVALTPEKDGFTLQFANQPKMTWIFYLPHNSVRISKIGNVLTTLAGVVLGAALSSDNPKDQILAEIREQGELPRRALPPAQTPPRSVEEQIKHYFLAFEELFTTILKEKKRRI